MERNKTDLLRITALFLSMVILFSGCAQIKEKFIRKSKDPKVESKRYQVVREYKVRPNLELYKKRYVFWKSWHRELLSVLRDSNRKKPLSAVREDISNLSDMRNMLTDDKAEGVKALIDIMEECEKILKERKITPGNDVRIRKKLKSVRTQVEKNFSPKKVQGHIRHDFRRD